MLMGTSPVVSRAAVANSNSIPDLSILDGRLDHGDLSEEDNKVCISVTTRKVLTSHMA